MARILLLRHGKSDWSKPLDDFYRPLKKRGRLAAEHIAGWMMGNSYIPDLILFSPATRAADTAFIVKTHLSNGTTNIVSQSVEELYDASMLTLDQVVKNALEISGTTLIVGHNPSIESFVSSLSHEIPKVSKLMPTCALAVIDAKQGQLALNTIIYPRDPQ
jgi:phosphohistidine phosphatase